MSENTEIEKGYVDCHIHMVLTGEDWHEAIQRHREKPEDGWIRKTLEQYRQQGFVYLRDGGDRWGVGLRAKLLAEEYGIVYRTPLAPLYPLGHYGRFLGNGYRTLADYRQQVLQLRQKGGDFVKIMISGLMDFEQFGRLTEPDVPPENLSEMVAIAHGEGLSVMAHCNGAKTALAAAKARVDSVEHGAYLDTEALEAMAEAGVIWVPTLSTIGNLLGKGRFPDSQVEKILESALNNVSQFAALGGFLAPGTDAGAWAVPHAGKTEYAYLQQALGGDTDIILSRGISELRRRF